MCAISKCEFVVVPSIVYLSAVVAWDEDIALV